MGENNNHWLKMRSYLNVLHDIIDTSIADENREEIKDLTTAQ